MKDKILICIVSALLPMFIALLSYIYVTDIYRVSSSIDDEHALSVKLERRVDRVVKEMLEHKSVLETKVDTTKVNLLEEIYKQGKDTNRKMNDVQINSEIANKNYEVLSAKFDNFVSQSEKDRNEFIKKLEDHDQRIGRLEKNVTTIAREKNITLFGWKYGYGE